MKQFTTLLLALLLCGCGGPKHVLPADFKTHYGNVGQAGSMQTTDYLGQRDDKAYICVSTMSVVSQKWSNQVMYVELADLDPEFRDSLPKTEMKDTR